MVTFLQPQTEGKNGPVQVVRTLSMSLPDLSGVPFLLSVFPLRVTPAMWLKVPMDFCHYISVAAHYGFEFHHTKPKYLMMYLWLPEDVPNKVPPYGTHHLGVAGEGKPLVTWEGRAEMLFRLGSHDHAP